MHISIVFLCKKKKQVSVSCENRINEAIKPKLFKIALVYLFYFEIGALNYQSIWRV
jgi:hypothetical protein